MAWKNPHLASHKPAGRLLLALRAGPLEPEQMNERFCNASSALTSRGLAEKTGLGNAYRITSKGLESCPTRRTSSLDALIGHEAARSSLVQALEQTPVGKRLIRYVALFRPGQRQLSWDRVAALLGELLDMIRDARIERHGRTWAAPADVWIAAIDEILTRRDEGKLTTPLKSHGYLLEIIAGQSGKAEAAAETGKEARSRGVTPVGEHASHRDFKTPKKSEKSSPESAKAGMEQVKKALKKEEAQHEH